MANHEQLKPKSEEVEEKSSDKEPIDYMHPDGTPAPKPTTAEEKKNQKEAEELEELADAVSEGG